MKKRMIWTNIILLLLLVMTIFFALTHGASKLNFNHLSSSSLNILFNIRLPRILSALVAGASLSASGAFFQAALRNPIAEPGIMGVSSAASLLSIVAGLVLPGLFFGKVVFALIGGLISFTLILLFQKKMDPYQLIIIGVALDAAFTGIQDLFSDNHFTGLNLATSTWESTLYLAVVGTIAIIFVICIMHWANYLKVDDAELSSLGVSAAKLRFTLLLVAVILASITTACIGVIAFIGIIIPQIGRLLLGHDYQKIVPFSLLSGAWFLLFVDTLGRTINPPNEISANVILAIIGGPFMILILLRRRHFA
ncbi:MAG: iron ABC transporter permease [Candidatus Lactobacillus pullistercoris]|uniref:Probable heme-iron transport system permease protein IsdF n=1 Tax=Candidatus Lactobacillus pullistercoris TaxID=2838636 RepID=A0A9E2KSC3_9LACO|nr:iron ABC transporter permease [Candidatus Lactobacillus pullistercoris]